MTSPGCCGNAPPRPAPPTAGSRTAAPPRAPGSPRAGRVRGPATAANSATASGSAERVQGEVPGVVQRGQPAPAGDQHPAGSFTGQQRTQLARAAHVVEHDQQAQRPEQTAVVGGAVVVVGRDGFAGYTELPQQPVQGVRAGHAGAARGVAAQVEEEAAVRERLLDLVRGPDGEGGFAHPRHPGQHAHARRVRPVVQQRGPQFGEPVGAADEVRGLRWQSGQPRPGAARPSWPAAPGRDHVDERSFRVEHALAQCGERLVGLGQPGFHLAEVALAVVHGVSEIGEGQTGGGAQPS